REPPVRFCDLRLRWISVMDEDTVAKRERLSGRDRIRAVLTPIACELAHAEWIRGEQSVPASVPIGRRPRIRRMIEDGDADIFSRDSPGVIDPFGALPPDGFFPRRASRIHHVSTRGGQRLDQADRKRALFRVAHRNGTATGANDELAVDRSRLDVSAEHV